MAAYLLLAATGAFVYFALKIFRNYLFRSPLDNIPGPPPVSLFTGASRHHLGAMDTTPIGLQVTSPN